MAYISAIRRSPSAATGEWSRSKTSRSLRRACAAAKGEGDRLVRPGGEPVVPGIGVDLQDAGEAAQKPFCVLPAAARCYRYTDPRRVRSAPAAVVAYECPKIPGLGPASARVEHRRTRLDHEQLRRALQVLGKPIGHRTKVKRRLAHPIGQRRTMQLQARTRVDLRQTLQRTMVCYNRSRVPGHRLCHAMR